MKKTLYRDVKLKSGVVLPKGLVVEVKPGNYRLAHIITPDLQTYHIRYSAVFKPPSIKSLEKWEYDGYCKTVTGKRTEPDGYDEHGFPSWLLALGMI